MKQRRCEFEDQVQDFKDEVDDEVIKQADSGVQNLNIYQEDEPGYTETWEAEHEEVPSSDDLQNFLASNSSILLAMARSAHWADVRHPFITEEALVGAESRADKGTRNLLRVRPRSRSATDYFF